LRKYKRTLALREGMYMSIKYLCRGTSEGRGVCRDLQKKRRQGQGEEKKVPEERLKRKVKEGWVTTAEAGGAEKEKKR